MGYKKRYTVKQEHIDVQGIMDGLYYPFYMEECRHNFIKDVMGFDIEEEDKNGINIVLAGYTIKFLRPLKKDDEMEVTCNLYRDSKRDTKFYFKQETLVNDKVFTSATFTGVCVPAKGRRPYLPESISDVVQNG